MKNKTLKAFTLAETLITLSIIGVVASITVPTLMSNFQKKAVESKVIKFYSMMQNAIKMSTVDNGPYEEWIFDESIFSKSGQYSTFEQNKKYLEKYILPYIKYKSIEKADNYNRVIIKLQDGSTVIYSYQTDQGWGLEALMMFTLIVDGNIKNYSNHNRFTFMSDKDTLLKPFDVQWNGNRNDLFTHSAWGCKTGVWDGHKNPLYCAKLLQLNNWKIPDDYPW